MKSIFLIALFMVISCETSDFSYDVVSFYKCLLIDSDIVYNHINSLFEAIQTLDPIKLATSFTTIYPAIVIEVTRCSLQANKKDDDDEIILKNTNNRSNTTADFFNALLKAVVTYISPFLKSLGINLKNICNEAFPDTFLCDLLE